MDAGYAVLAFLLGFVFLMVFWGVTGISPLGLLRLVMGDGVNSLPEPAPAIMSQPKPPAPQSTPSSLRTDDGRTETTAPQSKFTEEQLLTLYTFLRGLGATRDKATPILKASGIPMNNNLWSKAQAPAPPPVEDDDTHITPFAGRRTRASYYPDDPKLEFQDPPR
jgi:hypothetical protein